VDQIDLYVSEWCPTSAYIYALTGTTLPAHLRDVSLEDGVVAFKELQDAGKIKHIGVSELDVEEIKRASKVVKVDVLSIEVRKNSVDSSLGSHTFQCFPIRGFHDVDAVVSNPTFSIQVLEIDSYFTYCNHSTYAVFTPRQADTDFFYEGLTGDPSTCASDQTFVHYHTQDAQLSGLTRRMARARRGSRAISICPGEMEACRIPNAEGSFEVSSVPTRRRSWNRLGFVSTAFTVTMGTTRQSVWSTFDLLA